MSVATYNSIQISKKRRRRRLIATEILMKAYYAQTSLFVTPSRLSHKDGHCVMTLTVSAQSAHGNSMLYGRSKNKLTLSSFRFGNWRAVRRYLALEHRVRHKDDAVDACAIFQRTSEAEQCTAMLKGPRKHVCKTNNI